MTCAGEFNLDETFNIDFTNCECGCFCGTSSQNQFVVSNPLCYVSSNPVDSFIKEIKFVGPVNKIAPNCNQRYLALASNTLAIYDLEKASIIREFEPYPIGETTTINCDWNPNCQFSLSSIGSDGLIRIYDLRKKSPVNVFATRQNGFQVLKYSPESEMIVSGGESDVKIFNLNASGFCTKELITNSQAVDICFSPAECMLALSDTGGHVQFWDVDEGDLISSSKSSTSLLMNSPLKLAFHPHGEYLIAGNGSQLSLMHWEPYAHRGSVLLPSSRISTSKFLDMIIDDCKIRCLVGSTQFKTVDVLTISLRKFESGVATALRTRETVNNHDDEYERNISGAESSPDSGAGADRSSDGGIVSTPEEEEVLFPARSNRLCSSKRTSTSSATTMSGASSSSGFSTGEKNSRISLLPPISTRMPYIGNSDDNETNTNADHKITRRHKISLCQNETPKAAPLFKVPRPPNWKPQRANSKPSHGIHANLDKGFISEGTGINGKIAEMRRGISMNNIHDISNVSGSSTNLNSSTVPQVRGNRAAGLRAANSKANSVGELRKENAKPPHARAVNKRIDHTSIMIQLQKAQEQARTFNQTFSTGGRAQKMIETAARTDDDLFAKLLSFYLQHQKYHSLTFNAIFLNHTQKLLRHRNERFVVVALSFLELLINSFGPFIRDAITLTSTKRHSIGVDVAGDERLERCVRCKNALMQICFNSTLVVDRLSVESRRRFEQIVQSIDHIVGAK